MVWKRFAALLAATYAVSGVSACARPDPEAMVAAPPAITAASRSSALTPADVEVRHVPASFRFPPGSRVDDLVDKPTGASFTLVEPDPVTAVAFYRGWLPMGFFAVTTDRTENGATTLAFTGDDGWAGSIFATAKRVAVALRHA